MIYCVSRTTTSTRSAASLQWKALHPVQQRTRPNTTDGRPAPVVFHVRHLPCELSRSWTPPPSGTQPSSGIRRSVTRSRWQIHAGEPARRFGRLPSACRIDDSDQIPYMGSVWKRSTGRGSPDRKLRSSAVGGSVSQNRVPGIRRWETPRRRERRAHVESVAVFPSSKKMTHS